MTDTALRDPGLFAGIPRVVHRVWLGDSLPERFATYGEQWRRLHPDWKITDWQDYDALPPLRNQGLFDQAERLYPSDWKRFEADLLRLELLWLHGGVYSDTDVEPLRPIDDLLRGHSCVVGRSPQHRRGEHPITNAVMAATPGHPYVGALIDGIPAAMREHGRKTLAQSVGPWHLTRTYEAGDWSDVTVLSADELYGEDWLRHDWNTAARRRGEGVW